MCVRMKSELCTMHQPPLLVHSVSAAAVFLRQLVVLMLKNGILLSSAELSQL